MDVTTCPVSNQKEEYISIQRVNQVLQSASLFAIPVMIIDTYIYYFICAWGTGSSACNSVLLVCALCCCFDDAVCWSAVCDCGAS